MTDLINKYSAQQLVAFDGKTLTPVVKEGLDIDGEDVNKKHEESTAKFEPSDFIDD